MDTRPPQTAPGSIDAATLRRSVPHVRQPEQLPADPVAARVCLLGGFTLHCDDRPVELPAHAQRLVAYLALALPTSRALTACLLWPDVDEQRAAGNLRSTVWRLHRICPGLLKASRSSLTLDPAVAVDVQECHAALALLQKRPTEPAVRELTQGRFSRELLPGWYDDWVLQERDHVSHVRLRALEDAADALLRRGRTAEAQEATLAVLRVDPLRESAWRLALRVHLTEGNRVEAMRRFQAYRALLNAELGVEPSPRMWALLASSG